MYILSIPLQKKTGNSIKHATEPARNGKFHSLMDQ